MEHKTIEDYIALDPMPNIHRLSVLLAGGGDYRSMRAYAVRAYCRAEDISHDKRHAARAAAGILYEDQIYR